MFRTTKFLKATLLAHEESQRQTGRTTHIAREAVLTGAVMVCHNSSFALSTKRDFGIDTVSLDKYLSEEYNRGRKSQKYIFDHFAEYVMIMSKLDEVERLLNV
jgi:hypothetical protein